MQPTTRFLGIGVVFGIATVGWVVLGSNMDRRTHTQSRKADGDVTQLWGKPLEQKAPKLTFVGPDRRLGVRASSTTIDVDLKLDQRLRGLIWYALYNVGFTATWTYKHTESQPGDLHIDFQFPAEGGLYDGFRFVVNGHDTANKIHPEAGAITHKVYVEPGQTVELTVAYVSRGLGSWKYVPTDGVANLEKFRLTMATDFSDIDFPRGSLSPSDKRRRGKGWRLVWDFSQVITGAHIGMVMPKHIQPGELASALSYSAPISLGFFFLVIVLLAALRKIEIHPVNYLFIAAAFFAFHLLFSYAVDHIRVVPAFVLSGLMSVVLVVSYLRLVVSNRFAFVEATVAQLVYLIGFSVAHFWKGYTGISVTVLVILTLFLVMQATGRIQWSEVLKASPPRAPAAPARWQDPWAHHNQPPPPAPPPGHGGAVEPPPPTQPG